MTTTEIWDDDFEFNPNSPPRKNKNNTAKLTFGDDAGQPRMSNTSSRYTLDWDAEICDSPMNTSPSHQSKVFTAPKLSNWAESGPSTPAKRSTAIVTENWDDDFEDKNSTPVRRTRGDQSSPTKEITRNYRSLQPLLKNENVDHKMLAPGRNRASSSASTQYPRSKRYEDLAHIFPGLDGDEEDDDFGFTDKDEDRTLTGRSRRPGLARLNSLTNHPLNVYPPPPVPSLPADLTGGGVRDHPQPFPRSPSSSVFSLPTTIAGGSAYYGSTAHLHPIASRTSSSGGHGFSHLPPSPPLHKERERRRLRKKSRPQQQGVFELLPVDSTFSSGLAALQEVERPHSPARNSTHSSSHSRPRTPQTPNSSVPSSPFVSPLSNTTPSSIRHSNTSNPPPTPSGAKGALLSRIGSVKKWGVRRKRGVSISQKNAPPIDGQDLTMGVPDDPRAVTRPTSSLSSLPLSSASSHHTRSRPVSPALNVNPNRVNGGWFFRNSGAFAAPLDSSSVRGGNKANASMSDLSFRGRTYDRPSRASVEGKNQSQKPSSSRNRDRNRAPSRSRDTQARAQTPGLASNTHALGSGNEKDVADTPSKLLKRKSLGFVHLRRTLSGLGNGSNGDAQNGLKSERSGAGGGAAAGQPRHASYGGVSHKSVYSKADVFQDRENLDLTSMPPLLDVRGRKKSLSVSTTKMRQDASDAEKPQDARNSFIRSVRKISIVGRHKNEKSGTTLGRFVEEADRASMDSQPDITAALEVTKDAYAILPQDLLSSAEILDTPLASNELSRERTASESTSQADVIDAKPVLPQTPRRKVSNPTTPSTSPKRTPPAISPTSPTRGSTSQQSASLGRSTYSPSRQNGSPDEKVTPRRNSLGDLKIPTRISQAQVGLRRDLGMVREFAHSIEQLGELQSTYHGLVVEIQTLLDAHTHLRAQQQATRSVSPSFFSRPVGRKRSDTNPGPAFTPEQHMAYKELASAFYTINSKYRITWECAELLIELGGGSSAAAPGPPRPTTSVSAPTMQTSGNGGSSLTKRKGRERAITLAGDESKPPSPMPGAKSFAESSSTATAFANSSGTAWHASASRQDLSQRQMILLKELLNNADSSFMIDEPPIQEELSPNKEWKWGDPSNSTVTLPPSESSGAPSTPPSSRPNKKRRASRLGIAGLRDLLKMLKRHHTAHPTYTMPSFGSIPQSTSSLASATNSSEAHYEKAFRRRRAKTSISSSGDLPPLTSTFSMYDSTPLPSRGRPSLASIFRIPNPLRPHKVFGPHPAQPDDIDGKKGKNTIGGSNSPAEEDWDQIDVVTDLGETAKVGSGGGDGMATIRGKGRSLYLQQPPPSSYGGGRMSPRPKTTENGSQTSLYEDSPSSSLHNVRSARLSNVDEDGGEHRPGTGGSSSASHYRSAQRPSSRSSRPPPSPSSSANDNMDTNMTPPPRASSRHYLGNKTSKNGSVRSMPPQRMAELRLAMTPENIKPLVENAKEVNVRLVECIGEIRTLLESHKSLMAPEPAG